MAITIDLEIFREPTTVFIWLCKSFGPPGLNHGRWDLRDLRYIDFQNDMDKTFVLLKFDLKGK
jgi:hypothetical protein